MAGQLSAIKVLNGSAGIAAITQSVGHGDAPLQSNALQRLGF